MVTLPDGTTLWADRSGAGPPVVCCHGGPGLWDYLGPLAALLDDSHTVVRYDQRGCGRSSGADGPFTLEGAVADLDDLRAALGFERWAVLGHSWGAELAVRYAAAYPQRTTAVVYVGGVGAGDEYRDGFAREFPRRLGADFDRWRELRERDRVRTPDEEHEFCLLQWRPDFVPGPHAAQHAEALWATRPPGSEVNQRANRQLWEARSGTDLLATAASVRAPVTMIQGAQDPRPWQVTDSLYRALPHVERIVVDDAGHAPWAEQPELVRRTILTALTGSRAGRKG